MVPSISARNRHEASFALRSCLACRLCAPRLSRRIQRALPAPTDQLFTEKYPDFLSWDRTKGLELLAAEKKINPAHFNKAVYSCLGEYDYKQMWPDDRATLDLAARRKSPDLCTVQSPTRAQRADGLEEEAERYCGIEDIGEVINTN